MITREERADVLACRETVAGFLQPLRERTKRVRAMLEASKTCLKLPARGRRLHYLDASAKTEINSRAFVVHLAHSAAQLYNLDGNLILPGHASEVGDASEDRRHFPPRRCADRTTLCGIMAIIGGCNTVPVRPWA